MIKSYGWVNQLTEVCKIRKLSNLKLNKMGQEIKDAIHVLKHLKSLKGDYNGFAKHANSKDFHLIGWCCFNLLKENIKLPLHKKKYIEILLKPIK